MPCYIEFECTNAECDDYLTWWEAFVSVRDDGDGGYEYVPSYDGEATELRNNVCGTCGVQGEEI